MDYLLNAGMYMDDTFIEIVLNLIINGLPSKLYEFLVKVEAVGVLNLIINGLPSKPLPKG